MDKEARVAKKQREDQALNRVLWWFGGTVVLEFFLLLLNRFYINFNADGVALARSIFRFLRVAAWVCFAAAVATAAWWAVRRKKGGKTFLPGALFITSLVLTVCCLVAGIGRSMGVKFLYVCVPVMAVLALVYYLYQREFFLVAVLGGVVLFAMWMYRELIYSHALAVHIVFAVMGALTLATAALFYVLQKHDGKLGKVRILPKKTNYIPLYLAAAITALCLILALVLGATAAYALIFAMVAWLFGIAVYYTVRLM